MLNANFRKLGKFTDEQEMAQKRNQFLERRYYFSIYYRNIYEDITNEDLREEMDERNNV